MADGILTAQPYFGSPATSVLPGVPTTPFSPTPTAVPTFQNILDLFKNQPTIKADQPIAGGSNFNAGVSELAPSNGLRPEIQSALDLINRRGAEAKARNVADAMSLALKRGQAGSSTELFGTAEAAKAADEATQTQTANLLLDNAHREQALQDARSKAYLDRSNLEATLGTQLGINTANLSNDQLTKLATLTSDEIASLRNMDFGNRQLTLEALLGQQGLDIQRQNIGISQDIAQQQAKYGLISSLGSALLPGLLFGGKGGGGGGGLLGGLFGGGGSGGGGGFLSNLFGGGGGFTGTAAPAGAGSSLFPGGVSVAGGAAPGGIGLLPGLGLMAGGGLLSMGLDSLVSPFAKNALGTTAGGAVSYLLNPIGSSLNFAKDVFSGGNVVSNIGNKVGNAVKSVFRF